MEAHYIWQTKLFSTKFDIYEYDHLAGYLEKERLSRKSSGEMNGFRVMFITKGFFKQTVQIISTQDETEIGQMAFNYWKRKAFIKLNGRDYVFSFNNFFMTYWGISDENEELIKYHSKAFKGTIDSYSDNSVLVLTGLYVRNFFRRRQANSVAAS